jgi:hypothetical protein
MTMRPLDRIVLWYPILMQDRNLTESSFDRYAPGLDIAAHC